MKCEFDYCIYNKDFTCKLSKISIASSGLCAECIMVSFSECDLNKLKEEQLQKIQQTAQSAVC